MGTALTVPQLKTAVRQQYPRFTSQASDYFDTNLERWIYELCDWPFWFLSQRPSPSFFSRFPITDFTTLTMKFERWADIGWLIAQPGVSTYVFGAPMEDEQANSADWWALARVAQIEYCKVFNPSGTFRHDCTVCSENWLYSNFEPTTPGPPRYAILQTRETYSRLTIHPTPEQYYPMQIQFSLRECPIYNSITDGVAKSRFLNFAASAVMWKCLFHMADFFQEAGDMAKYATYLWGDPAKRGDLSSASATGGLIGKLKQETYDKAAQLSSTQAWCGSSREALGRGTRMNRWNRNNWMGGGYYIF